jgi:hypothetical protein
MRYFLKHLLYLGAHFLMLYGLLYGLSILLFTNQPRLDTAQANQTLFSTTAKYLALGRTQITNQNNKLILTGASNVREGFRPLELEKVFPGLQVHNLAIGASNMTQIGESIDLLLDTVSMDKSQGNQLLIGIWYGLFVENRVRWKSRPSDLSLEKLRFGIYMNKNGRLVPRFPRHILPTIVTLLRPVLFIDWLVQKCLVAKLAQAKNIIQNLFIERPSLTLKTSNLETISLSPAQKEFALEFWRSYMQNNGTLADEQFNELIRILERAHANRIKTILVDLPLPEWHRSNSPYFKHYQTKKLKYLRQAMNQFDLVYVNLQDLAEENDFYDSAHPKPSKTWVWSQSLARKLARGDRLLSLENK